MLPLAWVTLIRHEAQPIRIGVIHSLTGTMAISESPLVDAERLAIEEINASGGLLDRQVEMLVVDSRSDASVAATEAKRLIEQDQVAALFACWTSACRKAVKPVVESHRHLMFYPLQYEGLEESPNIVYCGSAPNQQIMPGAHWAINHFGKRVYLIGSDYIFPRLANRIIADLAKTSGAEVLAERYRPLGGTDFSQEIEEIARLRPDVVLNTVNGESNSHLFRALVAAGLSSQAVVSFSVAEAELRAIGKQTLHEHYAVWSYFQSMSSENNRRFVEAYRNRFGQERVTSDPIEAAYDSVHLWAQAVREAGSEQVDLVNRTILRQSMAAPSGILAVDPSTRHLWKYVQIGKALEDGQFDIVYTSQWPLRPTPFPFYRPRRDWLKLLTGQGEKP